MDDNEDGVVLEDFGKGNDLDTAIYLDKNEDNKKDDPVKEGYNSIRSSDDDFQVHEQEDDMFNEREDDEDDDALTLSDL